MPKTGGQAITRGLTGSRDLKKMFFDQRLLKVKRQTAERKAKQL